MTFSLHQQLEKDTFFITKNPLCHLLLLNNKTVPWFILVPEKAGITELYQLSNEEQLQFLSESNQLSIAMMQAFEPDKLNVAAIGNIVSQLHIHHIARFQSDPHWPGVIWGNIAPNPYTDEEKEAVNATILNALKTS